MLDFNKNVEGLLPTIIQDAFTQKVLMLGYMNQEAFEKTQAEKIVTFYSRSKKRLWTKGETSGNFLYVQDIKTDCDSDTILIKVQPKGVVCHTGADTCFEEENRSSIHFLTYLEEIIKDRKQQDPKSSYTASLFHRGINKIAQKVGEEAIELVIEAKDNDKNLFLNEAADLLFHYLVLLEAKNTALDEVIAVLQQRHKK